MVKQHPMVDSSDEEEEVMEDHGNWQLFGIWGRRRVGRGQTVLAFGPLFLLCSTFSTANFCANAEWIERLLVSVKESIKI